MFAKLWKVTVSFLIFVHPHATTQLPLVWFSWNLIFKYFLKMYWKNLSFIKIGQEERVLYVKTNIHFLLYLAQFLEWKMFHPKVVEKLKTHFLCSTIFFFFLQKSCCLWYNVTKGVMQLPKSQSLLEAHPYQSLSTPKFTSPPCKQKISPGFPYAQSQSCLWPGFSHSRIGIFHHHFQGKWIQPPADTMSP